MCSICRWRSQYLRSPPPFLIRDGAPRNVINWPRERAAGTMGSGAARLSQRAAKAKSGGGGGFGLSRVELRAYSPQGFVCLHTKPNNKHIKRVTFLMHDRGLLRRHRRRAPLFCASSSILAVVISIVGTMPRRP